MKRFAIILAVLLLAGLACAAQAVTLQQGWYVKFGYVGLYGEDGLGHSWGDSWYAASILGQSGPFMIQDGGADYRRGRIISVFENVDVQPGVLFEDIGQYPAQSNYYTQVFVSWETNYDSDQLLFQILRRTEGKQDELVWSQTASGVTGDYGDFWTSTALFSGERVVFRVIAVPEVSSLVSLTFGLATSCLLLARRRGF